MIIFFNLILYKIYKFTKILKVFDKKNDADASCVVFKKRGVKLRYLKIFS